ncbi:hypothetical protein [Cellvibrio sp. PSBB023]|uniref:hypothetical protein n=1 Tax=Cellvibrio sp. PSBB023 TaxID=1945512 RepID=UPI00098F7826|nr:hypothetical protein [Cellvibrio sp. PSBB023]AQT60750.1 hypothetical protein B0D95_12180 [Cellvibrio sp. PSBB023]
MQEFEQSKKLAESIQKLSSCIKKIDATEYSKKYLTLFFIIGIHIFLSCYFKDFAWLGSAGALISIAALLAISYEAFLVDLDDDIKNLYLNERPEYLTHYSSRFWAPTENEGIDIAIKERRKKFIRKYKNIKYYLFLSISGTIVWAYAGFLNFIFK